MLLFKRDSDTNLLAFFTHSNPSLELTIIQAMWIKFLIQDLTGLEPATFDYNHWTTLLYWKCALTYK